MARVENSDADLSPKPDFHLEMGSTSPLQLTLTKTSLQLIKDLVDVRNGCGGWGVGELGGRNRW